MYPMSMFWQAGWIKIEIEIEAEGAPPKRVLLLYWRIY
jgi:hypothetical protein